MTSYFQDGSHDVNADAATCSGRLCQTVIVTHFNHVGVMPQFRPCALPTRALSTPSQKSATVAENGETTATAEFGDSRTFLRQCGQALTIQIQIQSSIMRSVDVITGL